MLSFMKLMRSVSSCCIRYIRSEYMRIYQYIHVANETETQTHTGRERQRPLTTSKRENKKYRKNKPRGHCHPPFYN